ncbi:peptidoglycan DD-metalloendopeptidase family protein [Streptomyces sp. NPDC006879]|uniref:peptidoglycan DD-metalloendopeptidase family protein n=1 Tax=Streptomyces sp. NPDC006879 TaxID=3364767 RepID=UPI003686245A
MAVRGRHRRYQPSTINRASLTVTAGGAGMVLPLIGAGSAHAASVDVWNKVAACESSNNWHINTGNGYYGGLQFSRATWREFGGTVHASRADLASKDQQIAIAEKVLEVQGPGAWPVCSVRAGLGRGGAGGDVDPGATRTPAPAARQAVAPRSAPAQASAAGTRPLTSKTSDRYTVVPGDSLSAIADQRDVRGGWQALYRANRQVVGSNPNMIHPGQRLTLRAQGRAEAPQGVRPAPADPGATKPVSKARPATKPAARSKPATTKPSTGAGARQHGFSTPVAGGIGTPYRASGTSWASGYHTGVDFLVPTGTTVKAVATGQVVSAGWAGSYGYQIVIRHADGRYSQYAHLSALGVREGQRVNPGQRIGRSGSTGNSTGPHLHFEMRTGPGYGSDIDPLAYLRERGVSI